MLSQRLFPALMQVARQKTLMGLGSHRSAAVLISGAYWLSGSQTALYRFADYSTSSYPRFRGPLRRGVFYRWRICRRC